MTFEELKAELYDRGFNYLEEDAAGIARAERWLNQGYREILNLQAWEFLVVTATGTPGSGQVAAADIRKVQWVRDVSGAASLPLKRVNVADLVQEEGVDLTATGSPEFYYIESGIVKSVPVGGTLEVRYVKRVPPMVDGDTPVFDEEYHNLIVDKAVMKAYSDSDNFEAREALKLEVDGSLLAMTEDYLMDSREVSYIDVGSPYDG